MLKSPANLNWKIKTPGRIGLIGPSQAGKSTLILKLISDDSVWDTPLKVIIFAAPSHEDADKYNEEFNKICDRKGVDLWMVDRLPEKDEIKSFAGGRPSLFIIDDMLGFAKPEKLKQYATRWSHRNNITMLYCTQNPFYKCGRLDLLTITRNSTGYFLFYQVSDLSVYSTLCTRTFRGYPSDFIIDKLDVAKDQYNLRYVYLNIHPDSGIPRPLRLYTAIFADERARFHGSPMFFDARKAKE